MASVLDPSGFQIQAKISIDDGEDIDLWVRGDSPPRSATSSISGPDQVSRIDLSETDLAIVSSVTMEVNYGGSGSVALEISAPFDLGIKLLSSRLLKIGNRLSTRIGYPRLNRWTPWYVGQTAKPSISMNPDTGLVATINVVGGSFQMARGASPVATTGSIAKAFKRIAAIHNLQLEMPENSGADDALYTNRSFSQGMRSNWRIVRYLARMANCDAMIVPGVENGDRQILRIVRRSDAVQGADQNEVFTFIMRGNPDFITKFPILGFESELESTWLPRAAMGVTTSDIDPATGNTVSASAEAGSAEVPTTGAVVASTEQVIDRGYKLGFGAERTEPGDTGEHIVWSAIDPIRPAEAANSLIYESQIAASVQCSVETIGIPEVCPADVSFVVGMGFLDGLYTTMGFTHTANGDSWNMNLKFVSSAFGRDMIRDGMARAVASESSARPSESAENDSADTSFEVVAENEG